MEWHSFNILPQNLSAFLDLVQRYDSEGGNKIERLDIPFGWKSYLVVVTRKTSYPFVTNELKQFASNQAWR